MDDGTPFPKSFTRYVQIVSIKIALSLESSALGACLVHAVLLNIGGAYKWLKVQNGHSLVAFPLVECAAEHENSNNELTEIKESLYWYSS